MTLRSSARLMWATTSSTARECALRPAPDHAFYPLHTSSAPSCRSSCLTSVDRWLIYTFVLVYAELTSRDVTSPRVFPVSLQPRKMSSVMSRRGDFADAVQSAGIGDDSVGVRDADCGVVADTEAR